jgi:hypothetical protein
MNLIKITSNDKKKYALKTKKDIEILSKIQRLELKKLSKESKKIINFIKSQLEHDWRKPLIRELNKIRKKY